ncbi:hypothetical protein GGF46_004098 [Coemansia sp. RSA 552]|nr:hypothetical protein GGF46_004098 [Coemansia sp. RSA 552]
MSDAHIVELEMLRRQLQQLHELFGTVIGETRVAADGGGGGVTAWPELLSKFNVLAGKYAILSQAVGQKHAALLKSMAVVPQTQPSGIHEQNIMAVLLRTKLAPELEQEEDDIWAHADADAQQGERHDSLAMAAMGTFASLRKRYPARVQALLHDAQAGGASPGAEPAAPAASLEDVLSFASSGTMA